MRDIIKAEDLIEFIFEIVGSELIMDMILNDMDDEDKNDLIERIEESLSNTQSTKRRVSQLSEQLLDSLYMLEKEERRQITLKIIWDLAQDELHS